METGDCFKHVWKMFIPGIYYVAYITKCIVWPVSLEFTPIPSHGVTGYSPLHAIQPVYVVYVW